MLLLIDGGVGIFFLIPAYLFLTYHSCWMMAFEMPVLCWIGVSILRHSVCLLEEETDLGIVCKGDCVRDLVYMEMQKWMD